MRVFYSVILFFLLFYSACAFAMSSGEYVSLLENKLFGVTYENQPIDNRIDRIESQIYDNIYAGSPEERLSKIEKIYPRYEINSGVSNNQQLAYQEEPVEAEYNNYPIVSKIEKVIYQKDYSGEDIYKRLARLEKELYGQEKTEMSLQERVENLKKVLLYC